MQQLNAPITRDGDGVSYDVEAPEQLLDTSNIDDQGSALPEAVEAKQQLNASSDKVRDGVEDSSLAKGFKTLADLVPNRGGRLAVGQADILIDQHGECRWLDNTSASNEYFVPLATPAEWLAFVDYAPSDVTRAQCCPARSVSLTAGDGQTISYTLPIGREGAVDSRGTRSFSNVFTISGGTESVSDTFTCQGGAWSSQGQVSVVELTNPDVTVDPATGCVTTRESSSVVATWSGQMRRSSRHNRTDSSVGFNSVSDGNMDGNSSRHVVFMALTLPAKDTNVKITGVYSSYRGFSDGSPKVAEFHIADGQTVWGGAGNVFYTAGRKGDQFSMTNNVIRMPSYDSSPNLHYVRAEYDAKTSTTECPPPTP